MTSVTPPMGLRSQDMLYSPNKGSCLKVRDGCKVVLFQIVLSFVPFFEKRSHYAHTKDMKIEDAIRIQTKVCN